MKKSKNLLYVVVYGAILLLLTVITYISGKKTDAVMNIAYGFAVFAAAVSLLSLAVSYKRRDDYVLKLPAVIVANAYFAICAAGALGINAVKTLANILPEKLSELVGKLIDFDKAFTPRVAAAVFAGITVAVVLFLAIEALFNAHISKNEDAFDRDKARRGGNIAALETIALGCDLPSRRLQGGRRKCF